MNKDEISFQTSKHLISQSESIFKRETPYPFLVKRAKGAYLYDFDRNKFIDFNLNRGSLILGHSHPRVTKFIKNYVTKGYIYSQPGHLELRLAKLILDCYPQMHILRFTESKHQAICDLTRVIQDQENKKVLFIGEQYKEAADDYGITMSEHNLKDIEDAVKKHREELTAVCIEPVITKPNLILRDQEFWAQFQELLRDYKLSLILDEETTGFRMSISGGTAYYKINPDFIILGSIIGGGFPLYAFAGKKKYLESLSHRENQLYHPLHYIAGIETIKYLRRENPYPLMDKLTEKLYSSVSGDKVILNSVSSLFSFNTKGGFDFMDKTLQNRFFLGIDQCNFLSVAHKEHEINKLIQFLNEF